MVQPTNKPIPQPDTSTQAINSRIRAATAHTFPGMPLEDRLVKLLGVSPSVAHELASGERFYNTGMLEVIAQKIGYTVAMLFAGNGIAYCKPTSENLSEDEQALLAEWRQITPTTKNAFLFILDIYVGENSRFEQLEHTVKVRVLSSLRGIVELEGLEPGVVV